MDNLAFDMEEFKCELIAHCDGQKFENSFEELASLWKPNIVKYYIERL